MVIRKRKKERQVEPPYPGEVIKEYLDEYDMEVEDLIPPFTKKDWEDVLQGKAELTREMCSVLELFFGRSVKWWYSLQQDYEETCVISDEELWGS